MAKIYIAGKITGDPNYKETFEAAADCLRSNGDVVLTPCFLPDGMSMADYMRICLAMIDCCDSVFFLPNWQDSEGARVEHAYCKKCGKHIIVD